MNGSAASVGAILITEGVLVAILRFLALVYSVSSEAFNADRFRTPLLGLPPVGVDNGRGVVRAGVGRIVPPARADRRVADVGATPASCWWPRACSTSERSWGGRRGLARSPSTVEGGLTWIVLAVSRRVVAIVGLVRDGRPSAAHRRHPARRATTGRC